jgi:GntR family transcriptional regulator
MFYRARPRPSSLRFQRPLTEETRGANVSGRHYVRMSVPLVRLGHMELDSDRSPELGIEGGERDRPALEVADQSPWSGTGLDRRSRVPLYYQLQELLHQQIASRRFSAGDALPSEGELCRRFGVSRIVVRQALQVLEDDGEIVRQQGKGTFIAEPKVDLIAGGLVRVLGFEGRAPHDVEILDARHGEVEQSVAARLGATEVLRVDWLLRLGDEPMAIAYSFFRPGAVVSLERAAIRGARLGSRTPSLEARMELDQAEVSVATSHCSPYNAERLGVPARAPVFLVDVTEMARRADSLLEAVEVARVIYRSDTLSLQLEATTGAGVQQIAARISGVSRT